ncbi:SdpI family protein [Galbibacter sp. PAP.153]|uniref:SdpI family protein n=1 Tax=Galbibacter sp. PAP.153 TaxID=3104623 RepID=UPI0030084737
MKTLKIPEWCYLIIVAIPFIYLAIIWNDLDEKIPLHFNYKGEIDRWGGKIQLIVIPILLPLLTYLIMLFAPKIDPKKRIGEMGNKYDRIKFFLVLFMSASACYIIYAVKKESLNINSMFLLIGFFIAVLGNYMQTVKPNYFIGVKTPWTLENESVWKKTHVMTGKLWMIAGTFVIIASLLIPKYFFSKVFIATILTIAFIPIVYSYIIYKKQAKD